MAISNYARSQVALLIAGSPGAPNIGSGFVRIGNTSGTITTATTGLNQYTTGAQFTGGSTDMSTTQVIGMTADFNSVTMSGTNLQQFGVWVEISGGQAWQVENTTNTNFNGTQELQIQVYWQVY